MFIGGTTDPAWDDSREGMLLMLLLYVPVLNIYLLVYLIR